MKDAARKINFINSSHKGPEGISLRIRKFSQRTSEDFLLESDKLNSSGIPGKVIPTRRTHTYTN